MTVVAPLPSASVKLQRWRSRVEAGACEAHSESPEQISNQRVPRGIAALLFDLLLTAKSSRAFAAPRRSVALCDQLVYMLVQMEA